MVSWITKYFSFGYHYRNHPHNPPKITKKNFLDDHEFGEPWLEMIKCQHFGRWVQDGSNIYEGWFVFWIVVFNEGYRPNIQVCSSMWINISYIQYTSRHLKMDKLKVASWDLNHICVLDVEYMSYFMFSFCPTIVSCFYLLSQRIKYYWTVYNNILPTYTVKYSTFMQFRILVNKGHHIIWIEIMTL